MKAKERTITAYCPDCEQKINLGPQPKEWQRVTCPNCGILLEVISLDPLELDWATGDFEDDWWSDDDEYVDDEENEEWRD